jgi:hypothetical protein
MDIHTLILVVGVITLILSVVILFQTRRDHYEISDLASDVCKVDCLNRGLGRKFCLDERNISKCIANLVKTAGTPPPDTSFSDEETVRRVVGD